MSLQILTERITRILGTDSGLGATVKFKTEEGNVLSIPKWCPIQCQTKIWMRSVPSTCLPKMP
jgi:hypothetical protein